MRPYTKISSETFNIQLEGKCLIHFQDLVVGMYEYVTPTSDTHTGTP